MCIISKEDVSYADGSRDVRFPLSGVPSELIVSSPLKD